MTITITKKYLVVPVCYDADPVNVKFKSEGKLVFDLDICLNPDRTDAVYYVDFARFQGMTFDVEGVPAGMADFTLADEADETGIYEEPARPRVHFTAKKGWINDPNGCIKLDDTYHLYYQHNPVGRRWGNMHWGHAVSKDLLHWKELDIAMFPDETGAMYSGSAYYDRENVSGLGTKENPPVLFFYTAAGGANRLSEGKPYVQCLAYSLDKGKTLIKYDKNPILEHEIAANRDPKIIYSPERNCYYMALYLTENSYGLYTSQNLLDWTKVDQVALWDDSECPDFYPLPVEGEDDTLWVLTGASDRYLVGRLDSEGKFRAVQEASRLHYGDSNYAAQTYSGITDGRRIKIAWYNYDIPGQYFNCAMNIPTELTLRHNGDRYDLCVQPVRELETLHKSTEKFTDRQIKEGASLSFATEGKAQDIKLHICGGTKLEIEYLGKKILLDNYGCYVNVGDHFFPSHISDEGVTLRIVTDVTGMEIFAGNGEAFAGVGFMSDYSKSDFVIRALEGDTEVKSLEISPLADIWNK